MGFDESLYTGKEWAWNASLARLRPTLGGLHDLSPLSMDSFRALTGTLSVMQILEKANLSFWSALHQNPLILVTIVGRSSELSVGKCHRWWLEDSSLYSTEKVCVDIPGKGKTIIDAAVRPSDGDREIATRLAKGFPVGTVFSVSGGKWRSTSKEPPHVTEILPGQDLGASKPRSFEQMAREVGPLPTSVLASRTAPVIRPQPGEVWRPKDPRRIATFKVQEVTETEVVADDGRRISLDRWNRYVRIP